MSAFSAARAVAAGLTIRPHADTVRDTLAWDRTRPAAAPFRGGLSQDREREVLYAWQQAQTSAKSRD